MPQDAIEQWLAKSPNVQAVAFHHGYSDETETSFSAGAVQDETGTNVCIVESRAREENNYVPEQTWGCFFEKDSTIAVKASCDDMDRDNPLDFDFKEKGTRLNVALKTPRGLVVISYQCPGGPVFWAPLKKVPKSSTATSRSCGFDRAPWPGSANEENRLRRGERQTSMENRDLEHRSPGNTTEGIEAPWIDIIRFWHRLETKLLWQRGEGRLVELTNGEESSHTLLFRRAATPTGDADAPARWIASEPFEYTEIVRARPTPELLENSIGILAREYDTGSALETGYADQLFFTVLQIAPRDDDEGSAPKAVLDQVGSLPVGEIGFFRITGAESHIWRVFHKVRIRARRCIQVTRGHAYTARFNRETNRFSRQKSLHLKPDEDTDSPGTRYHALQGRYRLEEDEGFVKEHCP